MCQPKHCLRESLMASSISRVLAVKETLDPTKATAGISFLKGVPFLTDKESNERTPSMSQRTLHSRNRMARSHDMSQYGKWVTILLKM